VAYPQNACLCIDNHRIYLILSQVHTCPIVSGHGENLPHVTSMPNCFWSWLLQNLLATNELINSSIAYMRSNVHLADKFLSISGLPQHFFHFHCDPQEQLSFRPCFCHGTTIFPFAFTVTELPCSVCKDSELWKYRLVNCTWKL
jgi:hypothetical protein